MFRTTSVIVSNLNAARLKKVRDEMGLTNIQIMIPFVRTVSGKQNA